MATKLTRRDVMGTATVAAAAVFAASLPPRAAQAQATPPVPKIEYAMKKLAFDPAKVPGLSEKLLTSHYENNYGGAVRR